MENRRKYRDVKVGELLTLLARDYPSNEALVYPDLQLRFTFDQLEQETRRVAKGLLQLGIGKGERVALWATNVPEWVILQFALARIGAILVTVNTQLRAAELEFLLRQSESCALLTIERFKTVSFVEEINAILPGLRRSQPGEAGGERLPYLRHVIFIDSNQTGEAPQGMLLFDQVAQLGMAVSDEELAGREESLDLDEVINMQYTSGTTGFPKGVMLSHRNIVNSGYWVGEALGFTPDDRLCAPVPFFHCFGCVVAVLGAFTHASCLVPLEFFVARKVLEYVQNERCTALYGVPTMFLNELEDPQLSEFDLSSLRTGAMAGAVCPEPLLRRVMAQLHCPELINAYGLTEASPTISFTYRHDTIERRTQTVGLPLPEIEVRVIDPFTLETLPPNTPGELVARGDMVMKGYYNNPAATAAAVIALDGQAGWLRTGDQAVIDNDGYIIITGRIKDIIIRGGENISPKEVEDFIRLHPKVVDVQVFGVPSEQYGEEVAAAIRLQNDADCAAEHILEFCRERMARFKIPSRICFVSDYPMTASGKVQKFKLRELYAATAGD